MSLNIVTYFIMLLKTLICVCCNINVCYCFQNYIYKIEFLLKINKLL